MKKAEHIESENELTAEIDNKPKIGDKITTRFGKITLTNTYHINFPKGILGMSERRNFCIVPFPVQKFAEFKLLQSLDIKDLSFIIKPLASNNNIIDVADIKIAKEELSMQDPLIYVIISVHRGVDSISLSCNARAPIIIDNITNIAEQYVLRNNKYAVRHAIKPS